MGLSNGGDKNAELATAQGSENTASDKYQPSIWLFWRSRRYIVTLLIFFGLFNDYALRVNMSVALVDMTQPKNVTLENGTTVLQRDFDWDTKIQGHILSSYYYGYLLTQMVGGYLSTRFGGKPVFAVGIAGMAILHLVTPLLVRMSFYALMAVNITEGIFGGMLFPCVNDIFAKWAPPLEKSRLVTFGFSGCYMGTLVSLPISSMLATYFGWESIFYAFGIFGCTWTIIWISVVSNSPRQDKHITTAELKYITENVSEKVSQEKLRIPWFSILTSAPVWALTSAVACKAYGFFTLLTHLPKFVKFCLDYDLNKAGFIAALPYLAMAIIIQFAGQMADIIETKKLFSTTLMRKMFVVCGLIVQCIFMVLVVHWLSIVGSNFCLIMAVGLGGFAMAVFTVNPLDLSPNYGSIIGGINHTFGTISGILSPMVTGYIVTEETDLNQWREVFYLASGIYLIGALSFGIFGSGELQLWDNCDKVDEEKKHQTKSPCYINKEFDAPEL